MPGMPAGSICPLGVQALLTLDYLNDLVGSTNARALAISYRQSHVFIGLKALATV